MKYKIDLKKTITLGGIFTVAIAVLASTIYYANSFSASQKTDYGNGKYSVVWNFADTSRNDEKDFILSNTEVTNGQLTLARMLQPSNANPLAVPADINPPTPALVRSELSNGTNFINANLSGKGYIAVGKDGNVYQANIRVSDPTNPLSSGSFTIYRYKQADGTIKFDGTFGENMFGEGKPDEAHKYHRIIAMRVAPDNNLYLLEVTDTARGVSSQNYYIHIFQPNGSLVKTIDLKQLPGFYSAAMISTTYGMDLQDMAVDPQDGSLYISNYATEYFQTTAQRWIPGKYVTTRIGKSTTTKWVPGHYETYTASTGTKMHGITTKLAKDGVLLNTWKDQEVVETSTNPNSKNKYTVYTTKGGAMDCDANILYQYDPYNKLLLLRNKKTGYINKSHSLTNTSDWWSTIRVNGDSSRIYFDQGNNTPPQIYDLKTKTFVQTINRGQNYSRQSDLDKYGNFYTTAFGSQIPGYSAWYASRNSNATPREYAYINKIQINNYEKTAEAPKPVYQTSGTATTVYDSGQDNTVWTFNMLKSEIPGAINPSPSNQIIIKTSNNRAELDNPTLPYAVRTTGDALQPTTGRYIYIQSALSTSDPNSTPAVKVISFSYQLGKTTSDPDITTPDPNTTAPSIGTIIPSQASYFEVVQIPGNGFGNTEGKVTLGNNAIPSTNIYSWTDTKITLSLPYGVQPDKWIIYPANSNNNSFIASKDVYQIKNPQIKSPVSVTKDKDGNANITISGANFGTVIGIANGKPVSASLTQPGVSIGSTDISNIGGKITSWNATQITLTLPKGTLFTGKIQVKNSDGLLGISKDQITY